MTLFLQRYHLKSIVSLLAFRIKSKVANKQLTEENAQLTKDKKLLVEYNSTLKETIAGMIEEYRGLETLKGSIGS